MLTDTHSRTSQQSQRLKNDLSRGLAAGARLLAVMDLLANTISQASLLFYMHSYSYKYKVLKSINYSESLIRWIQWCSCHKTRMSDFIY